MPDRIEGLLALLPHDTEEARAVAAGHDGRVDDVSMGPGGNHRVRHVLEVGQAARLAEILGSRR